MNKLYRKIIRPLLFMLNPEPAHRLTIFFLKCSRYLPFVRLLFDKLFCYKNNRLKRHIFGMEFKNPVGIAAGLDKDAECFDILSHMGLGFVEVGTVTPVGQKGNPRPRLFRLPKDKAIINRMGFNNHGAQEAVKNINRLRSKCAKGTVIGGNIGKNTATDNQDAPEDYLKAFSCLYNSVDYFTVNVSCPNVTNLCGLQSKDGVKSIIDRLNAYRAEQKVRKPILLKVSSDLSDKQLEMMTDVVLECSLDGMVAVNTTTSREGLTESCRNERGGLSGKPLTQRAIHSVKHIVEYSCHKFPVIGVGGIMTSEDAIAMLEAGASLIQIYTGYIYNGPTFPKEICKSIVAIKSEESC